MVEGAPPDSPKGVLSSQGPGIDARPPLHASTHTRLADQAATNSTRRSEDKGSMPGSFPGLDEGKEVLSERRTT